MGENICKLCIWQRTNIQNIQQKQIKTIMMIFVSFFIGEQIDAESYPLFICLVLAMILVVIDGVYKQHAKGSL